MQLCFVSCRARGGFQVWGLSWEQQCEKSLTNDTIKLRITKGQDILVSGVLMFIILFNTTAQLHASPIPNVPTYFSVSHSSHFRFFEVLHSNKASSKYMGEWLSTFCRLALTHVNSCSAISLQRLYCTQMPSATLALYKYWQLVRSTTRSELLSGSKIKGALRNGYQYTAVQQGQGKLSGDVDSHRQSSFGEKPTCPFNICHTMQNLTLTLKSFRKMNLLYKIMMLLYFHSLHV